MPLGVAIASSAASASIASATVTGSGVCELQLGRACLRDDRLAVEGDDRAVTLAGLAARVRAAAAPAA